MFSQTILTTRGIVVTIFSLDESTEKPMPTNKAKHFSPVRSDKLLSQNRGLVAVYLLTVFVMNSVGGVYLMYGGFGLIGALTLSIGLTLASLILISSEYQYLVPMSSIVADVLEVNGEVCREYHDDDSWLGKIEKMRILNLRSWSSRVKLEIPLKYYYLKFDPNCEISFEKFEHLREDLRRIESKHGLIFNREIARLGSRLDVARNKERRALLKQVLRN